MSSTKQERSLGSGISIPQWMKTKTDNYGFDPSALSPPTHEDDFFYIRYPKPTTQPVESSNLKTHNEDQTFLNHTTSCKQFIPPIQDNAQTAKPKIIKPMGVDDGFKGEGAACGQSVVAVAQQMISGKPKSPMRGFTTDDASETLQPPNSYLRQRRNSKSLPASPLGTPETSPRNRRKNNTLFALQNRFFTGPFIAHDKGFNESDENLEKKSGSSWILSSLLASHRENVQADAAGTQEQNVIASSGAVSVKTERESSDHRASQGLNVTVEVKAAPRAAPAPSSPTPERTLFRPKPSELREMNFWSPTSM